jgi:hypothetical protein
LCACAQAAVGALREREAALLTVQLVEEDIEKKQRELATLEASGARAAGRARRGVEASVCPGASRRTLRVVVS